MSWMVLLYRDNSSDGIDGRLSRSYWLRESNGAARSWLLVECSRWRCTLPGASRVSRDSGWARACVRFTDVTVCP